MQDHEIQDAADMELRESSKLAFLELESSGEGHVLYSPSAVISVISTMVTRSDQDLSHFPYMVNTLS